MKIESMANVYMLSLNGLHTIPKSLEGAKELLEGGNILSEALKGWLDLRQNGPGTTDQAAALLGLAGVMSGLIGIGEDNPPFTKALSAGLGVGFGVLGITIAGIQLRDAINAYSSAIKSGDAPAIEAAYSNLADKTCGAFAAVGGALAAIPLPQIQLLGFAIWAGAGVAQQVMNGNMGRALEVLADSYYREQIVEQARELLIPGYEEEKVIADAINRHYRSASTWRARDPLAIDLDSDGIEMLAANAQPVVFDHNADGIKTGTGWLKGDDAWVVMDRNGNGTIDSGRELFGVDTLIPERKTVVNADGSTSVVTVERNAIHAAFCRADRVAPTRSLRQSLSNACGDTSPSMDQLSQDIAHGATSLGHCGSQKFRDEPTSFVKVQR